MSSVDFFESTVLGGTYRKPNIRDVWPLNGVKEINRSHVLSELLKTFQQKGGITIGSDVMVNTLHPLVFPIPYDFGNNRVGKAKDNCTVIAVDMRSYIIAENSLDEERGIYSVKTSKYNLAYVQLMLGLLMQRSLIDPGIENSINHVPLRAYVQWVSNAMANAKSVNNEVAVLGELRTIAGIYFLAQLNNIETMDDEARLFISRNLQKHLRLPEEIIERIFDRITDSKVGISNLGLMFAAYVDHPSFKSIGPTTVVTTLSRHIVVDSNYELSGLSVDSPLVFAVLLHYSFSREFNVRSNFKNILERSAMNAKDITDWASSFHKNLIN